MKVLHCLLPMSPPGLSIPHSITNVAPVDAMKVTLLDPGHVTTVGIAETVVEELVVLIVELVLSIAELVLDVLVVFCCKVELLLVEEVLGTAELEVFDEV